MILRKGVPARATAFRLHGPGRPSNAQQRRSHHGQDSQEGWSWTIFQELGFRLVLAVLILARLLVFFIRWALPSAIWPKRHRLVCA